MDRNNTKVKKKYFLSEYNLFIIIERLLKFVCQHKEIYLHVDRFL